MTFRCRISRELDKGKEEKTGITQQSDPEKKELGCNERSTLYHKKKAKRKKKRGKRENVGTRRE